MNLFLFVTISFDNRTNFQIYNNYLALQTTQSTMTCNKDAFAKIKLHINSYIFYVYF